MNYETVIGLEVHSELATKSKIYCGCTTEFGGEVNTHCCPICTGMPGTLPVLNEKVPEYAIKMGLATNCEISKFSKQDRKNYFYPDLPKAYQVSQFDLPLCKNGYIDIDVDGKTKRIGITRIHIEEDAGKLMHDQWETGSLVDFNRCGVPLIEIVTEPDMRSAEEAKAVLEKIKSILEYIEVSDCKMQEGSLRCDVNLSIRPMGQEKFGTRSEMKNLNSFRSIVRSVESEIKRQRELIESGGQVVQETRRWDDTKGISYSMRGKEEAHDYRYFPEPDLAPIITTDEDIERLRNGLPELPDVKKKRYMSEYGLPEYDAWFLTASKIIAHFFEDAAKASGKPKLVSNWIMGDMMRIMNENNVEDRAIPFAPSDLAELIELIEKGTISGTMAKTVFEEMFKSGKNPQDIVKEKGLVQMSDEGEMTEIVKSVLEQNQQSVEDFKAGKDKALGFLVGQAMKATKGKANPQVINKILKELLG